MSERMQFLSYLVPRVLPVLLVGLCSLGALGCQEQESVLQAWWGPLDQGNGELRFDNGGSFSVTGLTHRVDVLWDDDVAADDDDDSADDDDDSAAAGDQSVSESARSYLEVVLVGGDVPVSCSVYADYLRMVQEQQDYVEQVLTSPELDRPESDEWRGYVCQSLDGAALNAFRSEGRYRAVPLLLDITDPQGPAGGLFRPAERGEVEAGTYGGAEALTSGKYVGRFYERDRHGGGILPEGGDGPWVAEDIDPTRSCRAILDALVEETASGRSDYPDRASIALQSTNHRYYHLATGEDEVALEGSSVLDLGVTLPGWATAATGDADVQVTLFGQVSRAPTIFPYTQLLVSSLGQGVPLEPCPELGETLPLVWPEASGVSGLSANP